MGKLLTEKQKGFVRDIITNGNGTKAALKNYDTEDYNTASVIASENLEKPHIQREIIRLFDHIEIELK